MFAWCSISSFFQNSFKTSGHRDYEFLEFWSWNFVPFLADIGFQLLKSSWSSLTYFLFNNASNVLYKWKIWTAGRPIQHLDSSTTKPCCCNSCSMSFCIVLLKYTLPGSICCSKILIYLSAFIVPSKTCKLPILYALMDPHNQRCGRLNWTLITHWKFSLLFCPEDTVSGISNKNVIFWLVGP